MSQLLELNKVNRLRLARAFRHNPRVDYSLDCVIEGQMGQAVADDAEPPRAYRVSVGPFWYFAGDAESPGGQALVAELPPYCLLMPSPPAWIEAAQRACPLVTNTRYSFSTERLSEAHLTQLWAASPWCEQVAAADAALLARFAGRPDNCVDIGDFESPADFEARGLGFVALDGDRMMGAAYSSLVCSRGIEVSLYVDEPYRRRGVATAVSARLLLECLRQGLRPNWDAANEESCRLAQKLGFEPAGAYDAYFYRRP